jgi:hypothetical protein
VEDGSWHLLWSSERAEYSGTGTPAVVSDEGWILPGESAVVMTSVSPDKPPLATISGL